MVDGDYTVRGGREMAVGRGGRDEDRSIYFSDVIYIYIYRMCVYVCTSYDKVETDPKADPF